jgi:hypothetical protein
MSIKQQKLIIFVCAIILYLGFSGIFLYMLGLVFFPSGLTGPTVFNQLALIIIVPIVGLILSFFQWYNIRKNKIKPFLTYVIIFITSIIFFIGCFIFYAILFMFLISPILKHIT